MCGYGDSVAVNIMIVYPERHPSNDGSTKVFHRSSISGLKSVPVDVLLFMPNCTEKQREIAMCRIRATLGKAFDLVPIS